MSSEKDSLYSLASDSATKALSSEQRRSQNSSDVANGTLGKVSETLSNEQKKYEDRIENALSLYNALFAWIPVVNLFALVVRKVAEFFGVRWAKDISEAIDAKEIKSQNAKNKSATELKALEAVALLNKSRVEQALVNESSNDNFLKVSHDAHNKIALAKIAVGVKGAEAELRTEEAKIGVNEFIGNRQAEKRRFHQSMDDLTTGNIAGSDFLAQARLLNAAYNDPEIETLRKVHFSLDATRRKGPVRTT